jgi:hypothetical protein
MDHPVTLCAENFEAEFVPAFPEFAADVRGVRGLWGDDEPGLSTIASDELRKTIVDTVDAGAHDELDALCQFMERMALSPDARIRYALSDSVLEELGDDRERLVKARLKWGQRRSRARTLLSETGVESDSRLSDGGTRTAVRAPPSGVVPEHWGSRGASGSMRRAVSSGFASTPRCG